MTYSHTNTHIMLKQAKLESTARIHASKASAHRRQAETAFIDIETYAPRLTPLLHLQGREYLKEQMEEIWNQSIRRAFLLQPLSRLAPHLNWLAFSWLTLLAMANAQQAALISWISFFIIAGWVEAVEQLRPILHILNPIQKYQCYTFQVMRGTDEARKYNLYLGPHTDKSKPIWIKDGALYTKRSNLSTPFKGITLYDAETPIAAWGWTDSPQQGQLITLDSEKISSSLQKTTLEYLMSRLHNNLFEEALKYLSSIAHHYTKAEIEDIAEHKIQVKLAQLKDAARIWAESPIAPELQDRLIQQLELFLNQDNSAPKGILLHGPSGSGKTTLARTLAKSGQCTFISAALSDLKGEFIGQTASRVKEAWKKVRQGQPCIFFIDECEGVFAKRGGLGSDNFSNELVQTFLAEWDYALQQKSAVLVIGATNRRDNLDEAALSRFNLVLEIPLPDAKARKKLLEHAFKQRDFSLPIPSYIIKETGGMSARDVITLASTAKSEFPASSALNKAEWLNIIQQQRNKNSTDVQEGLTWDDLILPEKLKQELKLLGAEIRYAEIFKSRGLSVPRSMLLYGPPGTGKTQIARVVATQSGIAFMAVATADMKAGYMGQSGQKVKEVFERARAQAPCILFIDEIDIIAPSRMRNSSDSGVQEILGQLLQEMDGVKRSSTADLFIIGASNCPDHLDSAVSSRFERKIEISLPDKAARVDIVKMLFRKKPYRFDIDEVANTIANHTEGYSGRSIQSIISRTERYAIRRSLIQDSPETATLLRSDIINSLRDERAETLKQQRKENENNPFSSLLKKNSPSSSENIQRFFPESVSQPQHKTDISNALAIRKTKALP